MNLMQTVMMVACLAVYICSLLVFFAVCVGSPIRKYLSRRRLHQHSQQFPCGNCHYFSNETALKCAVRPIEVMTEAAYHCRDFAARS